MAIAATRKQLISPSPGAETKFGQAGFENQLIANIQSLE